MNLKKTKKSNIYYRNHKFAIYCLSEFEPSTYFESGHQAKERFSKSIHKPSGHSFVLKMAHYNKRKYNDFLLCLNEVMAGLIYTNVFKQYVPLIVLIYNDTNDKHYPLWFIGSKLEINLLPISFKKSHYDWKTGYLVDCIMANWDVILNNNSFLITKNNINTTISKNRVIRIDLGGTMSFRARGDDKESFINKDPPIEHHMFLEYLPLFQKIRTPQLLKTSLTFIKNIYKIEHFKQLDNIYTSIYEKLLYNSIKYNVSKKMLDKGIYLIKNNTDIIKMRWIWYLDNHDF